IICVLLLCGEAFLLKRLAGNYRNTSAFPQFDLRALGQELGYITRIKTSLALTFAAILMVCMGTIWQLLPARSQVALKHDPMVLFPMGVGSWHGKPERLDKSIEQVLKADDYVLADYIKGSSKVNLLVAYYTSQAQGSGIHSPAVCLPGGGWEVSDWATSKTGL